MKRERRMNAFIHAISHYFTFFILVAFVITCCILLFLNVLSETLQIEFSRGNIAAAAQITFWNVILISFILTVIDGIRRRISVHRPVKQISEAAEKMIHGDFSVRVPKVSRLIVDDKFNDIIDCINKMASELASVETLRTDFIANVSHEMKTPLAVMQNYSTLLSAPEISDEKRIEYARVIGESARRLADMMTNILKLNRLENQQIYPKVGVCDLGEQLCECFLQFENVWEDRGIEIDTEIEENVYVSADSELLSLVWNNLFSNAFKFTDPGGSVKLSLYTEGKYAVVCVRDSGCGMSPEVGTHIFEKFYQGDTSHATQGNGLGLALVKRVIDIMQGEIEVESVIGKGTAFTVKIRRMESGLEEAR